MNKLKLLLEDEVKEELDEVVEPEVSVQDETFDEEDPSVTDDNELIDEDLEDMTDFITSDELNELREIILDIPEEYQLLLLDQDTIVLGLEEDNKYKVATLSDDVNDFILIDMPLELDAILHNDSIIKYTSETVDSRHDKVVDILMKQLQDEPTEEPEEVEGDEEDEQKDQD